MTVRRQSTGLSQVGWVGSSAQGGNVEPVGCGAGDTTQIPKCVLACLLPQEWRTVQINGPAEVSLAPASTGMSGMGSR